MALMPDVSEPRHLAARSLMHRVPGQSGAEATLVMLVPGCGAGWRRAGGHHRGRCCGSATRRLCVGQGCGGGLKMSACYHRPARLRIFGGGCGVDVRLRDEDLVMRLEGGKRSARETAMLYLGQTHS